MSEIITTEATFINNHCVRETCPILQLQSAIRASNLPINSGEERARQLCQQAGLNPSATYSSWMSFEVQNKTRHELIIARAYDGPIFDTTCSNGIDIAEGEFCGRLVVGQVALAGVNWIIDRVKLVDSLPGTVEHS